MKKVLIIDEYDTVSKAYFDLLYEKNYKVEVSIDADEIVPRAKRFNPDIVVLNNDLPGFDGKEVCDIIDRELKTPIMLLVNKQAVTSKAIDGCKATEIIIKPFDKHTLIETLKRIISSHRS